MGKFSNWLNTEIVSHPDIEKPCVKLDYCPYGQLVEEFPFSENELSCTIKNGAIVQFGHDCPVHYHAEFVGEEDTKDIMDKLRQQLQKIPDTTVARLKNVFEDGGC